MKNVLIIDTGGTFSQEPTQAGLAPSKKDWLSIVPEIRELANIDYHGLEQGMQRIDSTEMTTTDRISLANIIDEHHSSYDGFVIVQGTDTMTETGAALNYMLQQPSKPIILTGSQTPIFKGTKTDAKRNIYHAVQAATSELGEVAVAFGDVLLRANRIQKIDEEQYRAFDTPRIPALAEFDIGEETRLGSHAHRRTPSKPEVFTDFDTQVAFYWQSSGITTNHLDAIVEDENVSGIVFAAFGAGNVRTTYHQSIQRAIQEHNKPVVIATQCMRGKAELDLYDVSNQVVKAGAISAHNLTPQAATQKLMYALGKAHTKRVSDSEKQDYVTKLMQTDIGGDMQLTNQAVTQELDASGQAQQSPYSYA